MRARIATPPPASTTPTKPLRLFETRVAPEWIDYNGHMTESRYLQVFADSSDALLLFLGIDEAYHRRRGSYFTVETHLMHLKEVKALEPIHTTTQILSADDKRLHVFQTMRSLDDGRCARHRRADAAPRRYGGEEGRSGRAGRARAASRPRRQTCGSRATADGRTRRRAEAIGSARCTSVSRPSRRWWSPPSAALSRPSSSRSRRRSSAATKCRARSAARSRTRSSRSASTRRTCRPSSAAAGSIRSP